MLFDIKAKQITLTEGILANVEKALKTLDKKVEHLGTAVSGHVEVCKTTRHHKKGEVFHAELIIRVPGKKIVAESTNEDLYVAINEVRREAERQIVGFKGKKTAGVTRGARLAKRNANVLPGEKPKKGGRALEESL